MLKNIDGLTEDYTLNMGALTIRFYTDEEIHVTVTDVFLPIVTHHKFRPKNFSPEQYYQVNFFKCLKQCANFSIF